jgi:hypothetical protein
VRILEEGKVGKGRERRKDSQGELVVVKGREGWLIREHEGKLIRGNEEDLQGLLRLSEEDIMA